MSETPDFLEYVFTDVHGCLSQLQEAVVRCLEHARGNRRRPRFIGLGDYVDRGPHSSGVIGFLLSLSQIYECYLHLGNHEDMMLEALNDISRGNFETAMVDAWWREGGRETLQSYGHEIDAGARDAHLKVPQSHLNLMRSMRVLSRTPHRVYVHGGLMPKVPLADQDRNTCLWIRDRFMMVANPKFKHLFPGVDYVVHGHTPQWAGKPSARTVEENGFRLNLDCGTPWTGVLSVAVFQPEVPGGPIEIIRVEGEPPKREVNWSRGIR